MIAHHFKFVFLPANNRCLNKNLSDWARIKAVRSKLQELFHRVRNTGSTSAKDVCRTNNHRKTDFLQDFCCFVHVVGDATARNFEANLDHCLFELVTVFSSGNCFSICTNELWSTRNTDKAFFKKGHCKVQTCLTAKSWQHSIWFLTFNDAGQDFWSQRFDICAVSKVWVRHDGRWV